MSLSIRVGALIAIATVATLPACKAKPDAAAPTAARGNKDDQALAGTLGSKIVVDPMRTAAHARGNPKAAAATASADPCAVRYGAGWAARLMPETPIYPGAKVGEAAGSDTPGCRRRIVSFVSAAPAATILDYYDARVRKAGYSAEHLVQDGGDVLGGTRGEAAYYITITPAKGGGSAVDLIATPGG